MSTTTIPRGERLEKAPTGIRGFDEITGGGLPRGRPTLVCGGPGCGKTLFGTEFLLRGALEHGEPGLFVSFEESALDLAKNVASLGHDLGALLETGKISVDHVRVERSEIEQTGEYDLEGLFVRLGFAIDTIGARRVVLDTIEALFASLPDEGILRSELRRLFGWLKDRGMTAVITAERGEGALTRHGLEEYVSDCVVLLDQRVYDQIATRRLRIVKYRGSAHGTNEYPFLIHEGGFTVMPTTSTGLTHPAPEERVSTGVARLDEMLGGTGVYRGSSVLVSGTAGTGKSSLAAHMAAASGQRGERCLYFAFEESRAQILRNMRSVGIDLAVHEDRGLLRFHVARPTLFGLEMHLAVMLHEIERFAPSFVVLDPITNLVVAGSQVDVRSTLVRLIDFLKTRGVTGVFTSLTTGETAEQTDVGVSSLMDVWLLVKMMEGNGERNRGLYILKARGTAHSNQVREFLITSAGLDLVDVYTGPAGVLTGTARHTQEARERAERLVEEEVLDARGRALARRRTVLSAQIAALQAELEAEEEDAAKFLREQSRRGAELVRDRDELSRLRSGVARAGGANGSKGDSP